MNGLLGDMTPAGADYLSALTVIILPPPPRDWVYGENHPTHLSFAYLY
jgi:hypothetical protein